MSGLEYTQLIPLWHSMLPNFYRCLMSSRVINLPWFTLSWHNGDNEWLCPTGVQRKEEYLSDLPLEASTLCSLFLLFNVQFCSIQSLNKTRQQTLTSYLLLKPLSQSMCTESKRRSRYDHVAHNVRITVGHCYQFQSHYHQLLKQGKGKLPHLSTDFITTWIGRKGARKWKHGETNTCIKVSTRLRIRVCIKALEHCTRTCRMLQTQGMLRHSLCFNQLYRIIFQHVSLQCEPKCKEVWQMSAHDALVQRIKEFCTTPMLNSSWIELPPELSCLIENLISKLKLIATHEFPAYAYHTLIW